MKSTNYIDKVKKKLEEFSFKAPSQAKNPKLVEKKVKEIEKELSKDKKEKSKKKDISKKVHKKADIVKKVLAKLANTL